MPTIPDLIERTLFFGLKQAPGPLLDIWSAIVFRTVLAQMHHELIPNNRYVGNGKKQAQVVFLRREIATSTPNVTTISQPNQSPQRV